MFGRAKKTNRAFHQAPRSWAPRAPPNADITQANYKHIWRPILGPTSSRRGSDSVPTRLIPTRFRLSSDAVSTRFRRASDTLPTRFRRASDASKPKCGTTRPSIDQTWGIFQQTGSYKLGNRGQSSRERGAGNVPTHKQCERFTLKKKLLQEQLRKIESNARHRP